MTRLNRIMAARMERIRTGKKSDEGFTLIELLVVIIIIGILAAIAIPVYLNIRKSAWEAAIEADVHNAQIVAENYGTANGGNYSALDKGTVSGKNGQGGSATIAGQTVTVSNNDTITYAATATGYTVTGTSTDVSGASAVYSSASGTLTKTGW